ncbi:MAG: IS1182 family transposase [Deltaproteobacteria bacterium]|nr:IS1182 family transposase [Deltaproteobacteria bacterium]
MARYKNYDYSQKVLLPVSLENQLTPGTLEFAIHTLVETRLDLSVFDEKYCNDETGRLAYDPKVLLKVVLLAYSRGLISSRKIERACQENVTFIALSCCQYPDHSTIAAFVSSMKDEILSLFRDVLLVCEEMGLLGGTFFALDGCKLPSNASKESSGTISELKKRRDKIEGHVRDLLCQQMEADRKGDERKQASHSSNEQRRKRQIERLQKQADRIDKWLQNNDAKIGKAGKEIKSNVTDNESAKMKISYGSIQGYNSQAFVDAKHQVIVHGEAFGSGQDFGHLEPMLDGAKENLRSIGHKQDYFSGKILTADASYHCASNIKRCDQEGLDAYIPDYNFRKRDSRFRKRHKAKRRSKFVLEDFRYDASADQYTCPQGKKLTVRVKRMVVDGIIYRQYVASEKDCNVCTLKSKCVNVTGPKRRYLSVPIAAKHTNLSKKMAEKIDSKKGRKIYPQRLGIVEPVFANIRTQKRLDRFTFRGKIKVNIQWLLYCIIHNMEKIANYGFV